MIRAAAALLMVGACGLESPEPRPVARIEPPAVLGGEIAITATGKTPAVASNGTNFLIVWDDGADLRGTRVDADGNILDAALTISNAAGEQIEPQVASNGTDYLVAWVDPRNGDDDIYAARVTGAGVVEDATGIAVHTGTDVQDAPRLASNGSDYLLAWESKDNDFYDIYANRISNGAVQDGNGFAIAATAVTEEPAVGSIGGNYLVTWSDYRSHVEADLYGTRVSSTGALVDGSGFLINNAVNFQGESVIATNGTEYLVAWEDTRAGNYDIYATHVGTDASVAEPNGIAIATQTAHQFFPAVASNGIDYFMAWEDDRNNTFDVYGNLLAGTTPSATDGFAIASSAAKEMAPSIAYAASTHGYLLAYQADGAIRARLVKQCGDGVLQSGEGCDDGNTTGGDGCSAVCGIESGYTCSGTPSTCADIDECATANGGCAQICTNTAGSYACGCNTGYALAQDGVSCNDIDECATANGGCAQTCTNSIGSFTCTCSAGYTLAADGLGCNDVNECSIVNGGCAQLCTNTPGSFSCACNAGYVLDGDHAGCDDVDECATANGGCSETCTNSVGGYACSCAIGEGLGSDGKTCAACAPGYSGDGMACVDIDECEAGTDTCSANQTCTNTPGSFTCVDNAGCGCRATDPREGALLVVIIAFVLRRRRV